LLWGSNTANASVPRAPLAGASIAASRGGSREEWGCPASLRCRNQARSNRAPTSLSRTTPLLPLAMLLTYDRAQIAASASLRSWPARRPSSQGQNVSAVRSHVLRH
jgi:hypothetical protein